ncbi:hypothetical protein VF14_03150 [Nostoc linckia z18]|jgi:hypothetical protein|uniref:Uncharacterized protein n=2 Tax=Nostoc linckia TaxID=92942 RepID=A0A9Q6ENG8_NOSLI|nr:hypothetical protein [Nostoc linckia]PHK42377.1 hypothetical protein VF12_03165 [Nostoc linckia z15]PHK46818.1 hypothetical protein VF13_09035 [Nostoc linckia z16]PHJ69147.1 hypothetical protein VF02_00620 [Nostoc linckia z1]PHJ73298.1 hypothetical protein VF05_01635 [Nostoc linckia z3]PHJ78645.1 hypothetical protein VF03_00620 [Nostoc linckia z2]
MAIQFQLPCQIGWRGKTYQPGLQTIPEDLAMALGWTPEDETEGEESGGEKTQTGRKRAQPK